MKTVRRIGLTGGIGAGKSTVAAELTRLGAYVIDADMVSRELTCIGAAGLAGITDAFGTTILDESGELDRKQLAHLVFTDPQARAVLESIMHPLIRQRMADLDAEYLRGNPDGVVVHEIPLLAESGRHADFDRILVVEAARETRIARLELRGLPRAEAERRIEAQADDAERRSIADAVIINNGELHELQRQVATAWTEWTGGGR